MHLKIPWAREEKEDGKALTKAISGTQVSPFLSRAAPFQCTFIVDVSTRSSN